NRVVQPLPLNIGSCISFRTLSVTYAMMRSRMSPETEHQAGRIQGGLCRGRESGDRPAAPAGLRDLLHPATAVPRRHRIDMQLRGLPLISVECAISDQCSTAI